MQGFKEFLESLQKMTDVRLNIAILASCLVLIAISPAEHFILDPVPKLIPQSLILITTIRLVFSIINLAHGFITKQIEKEQARKKAIIDDEEKVKLKIDLKKSITAEFNKPDVFQLQLVKTLIGKNNCSHPKGAALFSLCNSKITYVVATGERSQSIALTSMASEIMEEIYSNDTSPLEINAAIRAFNSMTGKELSHFKLLLETESIKTTWIGHDRKTHFSPSHDIFKIYRNSIIFEQPHTNFVYTLNPLMKDVLMRY